MATISPFVCANASVGSNIAKDAKIPEQLAISVAVWLVSSGTLIYAIGSSLVIVSKCSVSVSCHHGQIAYKLTYVIVFA